MFKSASISLILLGVLAIVAGIVAIAWPGVTVLALVIMFAIYAFIDALLHAIRAYRSDSVGPAIGNVSQIIIGTPVHSTGQFLGTAS
jgi:uncharacterized membrane protein HdeD (DUF308 family)